MKYCKRCRKEKPVEMFGKNKTRIDGLSIHCKSCRNEMELAYRNKKKRGKGERVCETKVTKQEFCRMFEIAVDKKIIKSYEDISEMITHWHFLSRGELVG